MKSRVSCPHMAARRGASASRILSNHGDATFVAAPSCRTEGRKSGTYFALRPSDAGTRAVRISASPASPVAAVFQPGSYLFQDGRNSAPEALPGIYGRVVVSGVSHRMHDGGSPCLTLLQSIRENSFRGAR